MTQSHPVAELHSVDTHVCEETQTEKHKKAKHTQRGYACYQQSEFFLPHAVD